MPWKNNSCAEQRWGFVRLAMRYKTRLTELCRQTGISRKTAYKWIERFKERGRRGLRNKTHCAHQVHNRPKNQWLHRISRCKRRHPNWGAPKIWWVLKERYGLKKLPSEAAISRWLKNWGLTKRRKRRIPKGPSIARAALKQAQFSNEVWTVDLQGWFRTGDGTRVEPLTVRDLASRYILAFCLMAEQTVEATQEEFQKIFRTYGLPLVIRADNGSPFGSTGALGLTRLSRSEE